MAELKDDASICVPVPKFLQHGVNVINWSENLGSIDQCKLQIDDYGFFLGWNKKGKESQVIDFSNVSDIRLGTCPKDPAVLKTLMFHHKDIDPDSKEGNEILGRKTLTVCSYDNDLVDVTFTNFVFLDEKSRNEWHDAVISLGVIGTRRNLSPDLNLIKTWKRLLLAFNIKGKIPLKAISKIFSSSSKIEKQVQRTANELGVSAGKITESIAVKDLTLDIFIEICNIICPLKDIDSLFQSITAGEEATMPQLTEFINKQQRDPRLNKEKVPLVTKKQVLNLIKSYEKNSVLADMGLMSKDGFTRYVLSSENCMIKKECLEISQDMNKPLSHYFISSSHNTYLEGPQIKGKSTVEMYRQVLLTGCRCIELDCWDGSGPNSAEPIITHGMAMCTEILFKDVIQAIKECAFVKSPYPVILSFENHCTERLQEKMAEYCSTIFGDLLLQEPLEDFPTTPGKPLPSPDMLKNKILIKNKKLETMKEKEELEQYWKNRKAVEAIKESKGNITGPSNFVRLGGVGGNAFMVGEMQQSISNSSFSTGEYHTKAQDNSHGSNTDNSDESDTDSDTATQSTFVSNSGVDSLFNLKDLKISVTHSMGTAKELDSWSEGDEPGISPSESPTDVVESMGHPENNDQLIKKPKRKKGIFGISLKGKRKIKSDDNRSVSSIGLIEEEIDNLDCGSINSETDVVLRNEKLKNKKKNSKATKSEREFEREKRKSLIKPQIGSPDAFVHVTGSQMKISQTQRLIDIGGGEAPKETLIKDKVSIADEEFIENGGTDNEEDRISIARHGKISITEMKKDGDRKKSKNDSKPTTTKIIHPYLSSMVIYTMSKPFKGFYAAQNENISYVISSFSEKKAFDLIKSSPIAFVRCNERQISRIYPAGRRYESSNLMPQEFWNVGCQLVCLNYQTPDPPMQLNLGKFDFNGQCGYLLKPDIMRNEGRIFDPTADNPLDGIVPANLSIQILSGYFLSERKVGTYVVVEIYGLSADTSHKEFRTNVIPSNGLNPVYNSKVFEFPKIIFPELAMLRLAVFDHHDKLLGQRVIPLEAIHCGYRHINLRTVGNAILPLAMLFCKIEINTYTPNEHQDFMDALLNPIERVRKESEIKENSNGPTDKGEQDLEVSSQGSPKLTDNSSSIQPKTKMRLAKRNRLSVINNK